MDIDLQNLLFAIGLTVTWIVGFVGMFLFVYGEKYYKLFDSKPSGRRNGFLASMIVGALAASFPLINPFMIIFIWFNNYQDIADGFKRLKETHLSKINWDYVSVFLPLACVLTLFLLD